MAAASTTQAHCNACSGLRNHFVLHAERTRWNDHDQGISGGDTYETLKCCGCDAVKLRHSSWFSEDEGSSVAYFPPAVSRRQPSWFDELVSELPADSFDGPACGSAVLLNGPSEVHTQSSGAVARSTWAIRRWSAVHSNRVGS